MTNTAKKTQSLSYPANPLAAMRELQALDQRPRPALPPEPEKEAEPPPVASEVALPVAGATGSEVAGEAEPAPKEPQSRPKREGGRKKEPLPQSDEAAPEAGPEDAMERAILGLLLKPYTGDPTKGPFTVTTVKVPSEVWERLGWASSLTGQTKQEIIALALKDWFAKLAKGR